MKITGRTAALVSNDGRPTIHLSGGVMLFGRSAECDYIIDSKRISRKHCCIAQAGDELVVKDLGSTNGCRVNGQRGEELKAREGDEITIGDAVFRFHWDYPSDLTMMPTIGPSDSAIERYDIPVALIDEKEKSKPPKPLDSSDSLLSLPGLA